MVYIIVVRILLSTFYTNKMHYSFFGIPQLTTIHED